MTHRARGFTLIEILIGIALVAVVLALVGPSMRDLLAAQRVRSINAELVTDLQFARSEAVRRQEFISIDFLTNDNNTCYSIRTGAIRCNCLRGPGLACGTREIKTVLLSRSLDVALAASSATSTTISFESDNGAATPTDFRIDVTSDTRGTLRVMTNALGRPSVCSPEGSFKEVPRCPE